MSTLGYETAARLGVIPPDTESPLLLGEIMPLWSEEPKISMHSHAGGDRSTEKMTKSLFDLLDPAFFAIGAFANIRGYKNYRPQYGTTDRNIDHIAPHRILEALAPRKRTTGIFSELCIELVAPPELPGTFDNLSPSTKNRPRVTNAILACRVSGFLQSAGEVACGISIFAYKATAYGETEAHFGTRTATISKQLRAAAQLSRQNNNAALERERDALNHPFLSSFDSKRRH